MTTQAKKNVGGGQYGLTVVAMMLIVVVVEVGEMVVMPTRTSIYSAEV